MTTRLARIVFWCVVAAGAVPAEVRAQGRPVETLYSDAMAKESAVQKALAAPGTSAVALKAVRTVVSDFEAIVRQYPTSGYCDDALWRAARLSIDAFERFGEARDKAAAARLLQALVSQYPTSKFARQAAAPLASLGTAPQGRPEARTPAAAPAAVPLPEPPITAPARPNGPLATIKAIRRSVMADSVRVIIELDAEVPFHDERLSNPSRVFVDLLSTKPNSALIDQTIRFESDADVVRQVRVGRHPNQTTRIVLDADGVSSYSVYPLYSPYRLVIDCLRAVPENASRPAWSVAVPGPVAVPAPVALPAPALTSGPRPLAPLPTRRIGEWSRALPVGAPLTSFALPDLSVPSLAAVVPSTPRLPATRVPIQGEPAPTPPAAVAPSRNLAGGFSIARQLGLGVSRIVIDPGHGGHDPGAKGAGLTEAELVLDIALRLEKQLAKIPGVEVVLTRRDDQYISLQERTAIANRESADLFLSIHANASTNAQARGIETYFLNFATNLSAASVAARENAASGQSMGTLPDVVKTIALNNKLDESRDFATFVQRAMIGKLKATNKTVRDLGVKQAPFVVLIGAAMPSVLAEVSFLTNAQEAKLLKGQAYRQKIADALFDAVRKYQTSLKSVPTVAQQE